MSYSHQITSMNESKAKQLCKKRPGDAIGHTETQLIRCYPNARRFDSSNFSPITFWSCGMQLIALNYQTVDTFQIVNQALFEQNSNAGYVLKPQALWNRQHPDFGRFNPFEKKKDAEYVSLYFRLISGQYLTESILNGAQAATNNATNNSNNNSNNATNSPAGNGTGTGSSGGEMTPSVVGGNDAGASVGAGSVGVNGINCVGGSGGGGASSGSMAAAEAVSHQHHYHRSSGAELLQLSSIFVEIEILGIPCDCVKEKTRTFNRNALNSIWNEEFVFHVSFGKCKVIVKGLGFELFELN